MKLLTSTWFEVQDYLKSSDGIIVPTGSVEQHGPIGLIGTDALCVEEIAGEVGRNINALIAPTLAYAPAEFNMEFPGTISISSELFQELCGQVLSSLARQGFRHIYLLNGHGANLEPLRNLKNSITDVEIRVRSWWEFKSVNELRDKYFGDWEGMHATPSEISITRVNHREIQSSLAKMPPKKLSKKYIIDHSGDKHGDAKEHRKNFPDGRVGSHSALAKEEFGIELMNQAVSQIGKDYTDFLKI